MGDVAATRPRLAGVIGDPIAHSKSPLIHNYWLRERRISGLYAPYHVAEGELSGWLNAARTMGLTGFNVTKPHKEAVVPFLDGMTDGAAAAGSVNTVVIDGDGRLYGDSTDGFGFVENLRDAGVPDLAGMTVAFLGAGGAARAVLAALLEKKVQAIRIANRTAARAEDVVEALGASSTIEVWPWAPSEAFFADADLIVNGTSLGMAGQPPFDLRLPSLRTTTIATDMIYAPLETPFLTAAAAAGARSVDGLGMLLHQARPGFERWFGSRPTVSPTLREIVLARSGFIP